MHAESMADVPADVDDQQQRLNDHLHALWLLWGSLTDWVQSKPHETPEAEAAMRRAAREWLEVSRDKLRWRRYFDRWLYDEMGYARPTA